jgi:hypothetical protein
MVTGLYTSLQQFLERVQVGDDLETFSKSRKADAVVVMTTSPTPSGGSIERQLGIYSPIEELRKKVCYPFPPGQVSALPLSNQLNCCSLICIKIFEIDHDIF